VSVFSPCKEWLLEGKGGDSSLRIVMPALLTPKLAAPNVLPTDGQDQPGWVSTVTKLTQDSGRKATSGFPV
jgi:hypothetical protein